MSGFLDVERVIIKRELLVAAHAHLAAVGRKEMECVVLWTGVLDGKIFRVLEIMAPAQTALRSEAGVCVRKRWLKIENYSDPVKDLAGAVVTFREGYSTVNKDAINLVSEL